jgi:hypothetical protein
MMRLFLCLHSLGVSGIIWRSGTYMYRIGESFRSGFGMKLKTRQIDKQKKSASFERVPVA